MVEPNAERAISTASAEGSGPEHDHPGAGREDVGRGVRWNDASSDEDSRPRSNTEPPKSIHISEWEQALSSVDWQVGRWLYYEQGCFDLERGVPPLEFDNMIFGYAENPDEAFHLYREGYERQAVREFE